MAQIFSVAAGEALLRWNHLAGGPGRPALPALLRRACNRYTSQGRYALFQAVGLLGIRPGQRVLVPAYHCATVVDALLAAGVDVEYYRVGPDCLPDLADIEGRIDSRVRALLVIHYFGFPTAMTGLMSLCRAHGLLVIEDCAHVLPGASVDGAELGRRGDVGLFSFRKFVPVQDGGCLVVNRPGLAGQTAPSQRESWMRSALVTARVLQTLVEGGARGGWARPAHSLIGLARWALRSPRHSTVVAAQQVPAGHVSGFDAALAEQPMSRLSRRILDHAGLANIAAMRRRNYRQLQSGLVGTPGLRPLHATLPAAVCPWVYPVFCDGRTDLHKQLRARGIAATAWDGVVHPSLPMDRFPDAAHLYAHLVFLPVHQDLTGAHLAAVVQIVRSVLAGIQATDARSAQVSA